MRGDAAISAKAQGNALPNHLSRSRGMRKAPATGICSRFSGRGGSKAVLESLQNQQLVGGKRSIADALKKSGKINYYRKGDTITQQGAADNEIYFLLCGTVKILVNGYEVASRQAGTHFGEMAAMDYTAKRSATVVADDDVAVVCVPQDRFIKIAQSKSVIWQVLARVMAARLRERTKFFRSRNPNPVLFVGSSSEGKRVALAIRAACKAKLTTGIEVRVWSEGLFQASQTVIEDLVLLAGSCDFAALVFTPDDRTRSRGKIKAAPRDNVVYELGLFTGALGRERSLLVVPSGVDVKIPTDLLGVTMLTYQPAKTARALAKRVEGVAEAIVERVTQRGPR